MEVDDKYKWMEEAGYKLVDGPLPVSKRQQKKGLGPSVYTSAFNSIEALEKNYLAQLPSHSLTDPAFHREREGVLNRIAVDKLMMKNRPSGPTSSIELPPRGDIYWIPVEASARAFGEPPRNWRTIDSGRPTTVTAQATALSTQSNQPQKGTMV